MDKAILRAVLVCLLWVVYQPAGNALDAHTEKAVRAATFEFFAPGVIAGSKGLVGTAFAIGPNEFVTAAHLFDTAIGSHFGRPVLLDSRQVAYQIADILQFSEQQDYVIFSLDRPPHITPLVIRRDEQTELDLYLAGWHSGGGTVIEHGTFSGLTRDEESGQFEWLRFSAPVWGGVGGGPLLDGSGYVIGIVQGRARNGGANYAVPIGLLPAGAPERAHIRAMQMLRSLMPAVSSLEPLEAEIPLPMSFEQFSQELGQLRLAYFDHSIGPLLEATRRNFVLTGSGAAEVCNLLNGRTCECKARTGISGALVLDKPLANGVSQSNTGDIVEAVAGAVVVRTREGGDAGMRKRDPSSDPRLHLELALKGQAGPDHTLAASVKSLSGVAADQDRAYIDFRGRAWHMRSWSLLDRDLEVVSLARKLPDGYVLLTRTVPTALSYAAELQLKFISNLIYYGCEELPGEGVALVADAAWR